MSEERDEYQTTRALAPMGADAGTFALAALSESEFEARIATLKRQVERVARIQRELMVEGTDYGTIPGTPKPTLYKSGAEKLTNFYRYAPAIRERRRTTGDGEGSPPITWDVVVALHLGSTDGPVVAEGAGSANSWEKKYRYRQAERACPECGTLKTIIKGKDEYERDARYHGGWLCFTKKGGCGAKFVKDDPRIVAQQLGEIDNPDPWDLDNTLLKMAVKRAYVDASLRATATSGLFTQDLEDMEHPSAPTPPPAQPPSGNGNGGSRPAPSPQQQGKPSQPTPKPAQPAAKAESDEMPDAPAPDLRRWFHARCLALPEMSWPDPQRHANATGLAKGLKEKGLSEKDRLDMYEYLTGQRSGNDLAEKELYLLQINAGRVDLLQRCAIARRDEIAKGKSGLPGMEATP